jgi:hypothetical protein
MTVQAKRVSLIASINKALENTIHKIQININVKVEAIAMMQDHSRRLSGLQPKTHRKHQHKGVSLNLRRQCSHVRLETK